MMRTFVVFLTGLSLFSANLVAARYRSAPPHRRSVRWTKWQTRPIRDIYAKGLTLVYFYPKAGTPGCTAEACSLRDSYDKLKAQGLHIIGVSRDGAAAQKNFHEQNKLPFTLVADPDGKVADAFGVPKLLGGLVALDSRQSFIVKDGKIAWNSLKAQTSGSAEEVQTALDGLK